MLRQMYDRYKETEQLCSWFRFLLVLSSQPSSSKQGVCQAPSGCCTGEARTNPPSKKTSLFLFFCRSEMYSYHRNNISTIWHMQGKLTTVLMQHFFFSLNVPERIRQGFDWSVTYSTKCILRIYGLSYWKTNSWWVESTLLGAHQMQD